MQRLLILAMISGLPATANAQFIPADEIAECQAIENNVQRLSCFDGLSVGNLNAADEDDTTIASEEGETDVSRSIPWTRVNSSDPLTGADTSRVYINASRKLNGQESPEYLMIQCDGEGGSDLFIGTTGYIGSLRDSVPVEYRWAEDSPISERWQGSTNGKAAFLPRSFNDFMSGLKEGGELVFRWQDFRGTPYSAIWNNVQLDSTAEYVLNGCDA